MKISISQFAAAALVVGSISVGSDARGAVSYTGSYNSMSTGSIDGQQGWSATNASVDQHVVNISAGHNVFQMSNAYGSGSFSDYPIGPGLDPAGEPATGASYNNFQMSLDFQSATGAAQAGLFIGVGPATTTNAAERQGTFFIYDNSGHGLNAIWQDFSGGAYQNHLVATDLSYTGAHSLTASITFVAGANNDVVNVSVDGSPVGTFTDYESSYGAAVPANTVLFKTFPGYDASSLGGNDATIIGNGLYFDNLSYSVSNVPEPASIVLWLTTAGCGAVGAFARRRKAVQRGC